MVDATQVYRQHPAPEEIDEVLGKRLTATIGTLNEDGTVHLAYVIFLFADGRLSWTGGLLHAETERELDVPYDDAWLPRD